MSENLQKNMGANPMYETEDKAFLGKILFYVIRRNEPAMVQCPSSNEPEIFSGRLALDQIQRFKCKQRPPFFRARRDYDYYDNKYRGLVRSLRDHLFSDCRRLPRKRRCIQRLTKLPLNFRSYR